MDSRPSSTVAICKNCGSGVTGRYCANCGEKIYDAHDKHIGHLFHEVIHFITHLDGKFLLSLRTILLRPGVMSAEFCDGLRKKYFKPVSLFLVGVVIYLLFPYTQGLNLSYEMSITNYRSFGLNWLDDVARAKAASRGLSMAQLAEHYDHLSPKIAKIMLFLLLPLAGVVLQLLFRGKRRVYFDHFILGTELSTFFIYLSFLVLPFILFVANLISRYFSGSNLGWGDAVFGPLILLIVIPAWTIALKRFYRVSTLGALMRTVIFFLLFVVAGLFFLYRFILFFTILLFI